ncbi:MAG: hypothetical protein ABI640_02235 [Gammaproteobacteria bacterium]
MHATLLRTLNDAFRAELAATSAPSTRTSPIAAARAGKSTTIGLREGMTQILAAGQCFDVAICSCVMAHVANLAFGSGSRFKCAVLQRRDWHLLNDETSSD